MRKTNTVILFLLEACSFMLLTLILRDGFIFHVCAYSLDILYLLQFQHKLRLIQFCMVSCKMSRFEKCPARDIQESLIRCVAQHEFI